MVRLIVGEKGKGKTKVLLHMVNKAIKSVNGNIVYLDKSSKHMYELNNKVRLIDCSLYGIGNYDEFIGFLYGILSQDHDIEEMFFDSFLTIAQLTGCKDEELIACIEKLKSVGERFQVKFILSVSRDKSMLPEVLYKNIALSL